MNQQIIGISDMNGIIRRKIRKIIQHALLHVLVKCAESIKGNAPASRRPFVHLRNKFFIGRLAALEHPLEAGEHLACSRIAIAAYRPDIFAEAEVTEKLHRLLTGIGNISEQKKHILFPEGDNFKHLEKIRIAAVKAGHYVGHGLHYLS